ncbi:MAG: hypothetical protein M5U26_17560 [Planctomycetota bacterium]|nr:hypothetical protein [Planctomycetota bacterium]
MKSRYLALWAILLLGLWSTKALADGPHWHVPNPDSEDYSEEDGEKPKPPEGPKPAGGGRGQNNQDWAHNPGSFFMLDQPCIDYYERHCVIKYNQNDLDFYLLIMNRCAQAMREVDNYLPCPDSFPLWHTEELRELMVVFAKRTWQRSTQLKHPNNEKCAEFAVDCFIDTVRFVDEGRRGALAAKVKEFFDKNKKLQQMLEEMDKLSKTDPAKARAIQQQWVAEGRDGLNKSGLSKDVAKAFATFKLVTGDIPMCVDEAEMRVMDALAGMGTIVLPYLQKAAQNPNPHVQRQAWSVINMIQKQFQQPANVAPSYSTIIDQLKWIQQKPGSPEATRALKILKNMGDNAVKYLIQIAKGSDPAMKSIALGALATVTGRSYGQNLEKYEEYLASKKAQEVKAEPKDEEKEPGVKGVLDNVLDKTEKKTEEKPAVEEEGK